MNAGLSGETVKEVRRFLDTWIARMDPLYMAVSFPPDFKFPDDDVTTKLIAGSCDADCARTQIGVCR